MAEGMQAGRLEVPVVASLAGFAEELRTKVQAAAEGLAVKVKIKVDSKGLRTRIEKAVDKASAGVTAKIRVRVDRDGLRGELDAAARQAASGDVRVPLRVDEGARGGGGLFARIRSLLGGAQGEADRNPVGVPVQFKLPTGRRGLRMLAIGSIISVLQPAIAAVTQYGAALTAMASSAAPAVGVLGAIPGLMAGVATAAIATKVAFSGVGEALKQTLKAQAQLGDGAKVTKAQQDALDQSVKGLSASARASVKTVASLSGAWRTMRQSVQEQFFSKVADQIKPLSSAVLPLLKSSLRDAAGQMGALAKRGAEAMRSGPFAKGFQSVAATNRKVIGNVADGVANLSAAAGHFLVASGPFVERVAEAGEKFTLWVRASAQAGRETGSLERFLDHAAEKATQLGRSTLSLGKGLAGVGRAGQESGDALLDGLEASMLRFSRWANSKAGQVSMKKFFSDAAPTFHELNKLAGDFFRGLGRMATDSGVRDLIVQIRTELMPGIGAALQAIGGSIGPAIIGLVSNIASLFATLSSAGAGVGLVLGALNGLLNVANGLMNVVPGLGHGLGLLLGTLIAFRIVRGIAGFMGGLATQVRTLGAASSVATGAMGPQISTWNRMQLAYTGAAAGAGRMTGAMRGVGAVAGSMRGTLTGLVGALGGPWGAAITGVTLAIGLLANSHEKAARAAQEQQSRINSLTAALRDSNGAIDANVRAQAIQLLQEAKFGDTKIVDKLRNVGVNLTQLTDLYLDQGDGLGKLEQKLRGLADAKQEYIEKGRDVFVKGDGEESKRYRSAADALKSVNGELSQGMRNAREGAEAMKGAGSEGTDAYMRLTTAVEGMSSSTATADDRVNSLKRALDALTGGTESFHDAQTRVNAAVLSVNDAMEANKGKLANASKELIGYDGKVNTATKAGQDFNQHLRELRDSAAVAAVAAHDMAKENGTPMADALRTGQGEMAKAREAAVAYGRDLGLSKSQAEGLANQMGLMPSVVPMLFKAKGMPEINAEMLALSVKLSSLGKGQSIPIKAPTVEAQHALRALGFSIERIPGSKKVNVVAPTGAASANMRAFAADIASTPGSKKVTVQALVKKAAGELKGVRDKVVELPKGKSVTVKAPTKTAQQALKDLGYKIEKVPKSKNVRITAPNKTPIAQVQAIQGKINSLRGKTVHVTVQYSSKGKASVKEYADGGIARYAEGGIRRAGARIRAFANGAENHVAQIAKAGEWRIWAEDETGGEAYLPLAKSKRKRSKLILDRVAQMFGGMVVYPGSTGMRQHANGAVSTYRASTRSRTTASSRASVPQGATSLVGGDLNINVGAVSSVGDAMEDAMFELRKYRLAGGTG